MQLSNIRPLTQLGVENAIYTDGRPCFSPDGDTILFERWISKTMPAQFFTVSLDNTFINGETYFYYSDTYGCMRADWSWNAPDFAPAIAFTGISKDASNRIVSKIMLLTPGGKPNSAEQIPIQNYTESLLSYPAWYPDGKFLLIADYTSHNLIKVSNKGVLVETITPDLFMSGMGTVMASNSNIVAFAGQPRKITYNQNINQIWYQDGHQDPELLSSDKKGDIGRTPWFSPDGTHLTFEAKGQIYLKPVAMPFQHVKSTQVTNASRFAQHTKFSPDGKTLVWAQQTGENCSQIYCGTIEY